MDKYQITFDTWNKIATLYQDKFMDLDLYNDSYDLFCQLIKKSNPAIFEIGCGPGNVTRYILNKRPDFKIKAIDFAPNMVAKAQENIPNAEFEVMDCRAIDSITDTFDGIICGFCIPYLSQSDCTKLLKDSHQLLNENGILYFSILVGAYKDSGFQTGSTGDKCYVYYHEGAFFIEAIAEHGFELIKTIKKAYPKGEKVQQEHLIFIVQKIRP